MPKVRRTSKPDRKRERRVREGNSEQLARWVWRNFVGCPITVPYDAEYQRLFEKIEALQRMWFTKGLHEGVRQMSELKAERS